MVAEFLATGPYARYAWAGGTFFPVVRLCQFFVLAGNRFWFYILGDCHYSSKRFRFDLDRSKPCLNRVSIQNSLKYGLHTNIVPQEGYEGTN